MNEQGSHAQENLAGIDTLLNMPIVVLFDMGASHSYISTSCMDTLENFLL